MIWLWRILSRFLGRSLGAGMKVIDSSALIDGRAADIREIGFLPGTLFVPRGVIAQLQRLADSHEAIKRARGRRGLDILARLQENARYPVRLLDHGDLQAADVSVQVVRLARDLGAQVVTTDFEVNKIAAREGAGCLNINDLALCLKTVALPGESVHAFIMKEGKEREQGIGYLDDGAMVVVEEGRRHIGKRVEIAVASILQTPSGRMIFGKAKVSA